MRNTKTKLKLKIIFSVLSSLAINLNAQFSSVNILWQQDWNQPSSPALALEKGPDNTWLVASGGFKIHQFDSVGNYMGVFFNQNSYSDNGTRWHSFEWNEYSNSYFGVYEAGGWYTNRIFEISTSGTLLNDFDVTYGQSFLNDVIINSTGDYFVAGGKNCGGLGGGWDYRVGKVNSNGTMNWNSIECQICGCTGGFCNFGDEMAQEITLSTDGNLISTGFRNTGGTGCYGLENSPYVLKHTTSGENIWKWDGRASGFYGNSSDIIELSDGSILISGFKGNSTGTLKNPNLIKLSAEGTFISEWFDPEISNATVLDILPLPNDEYGLVVSNLDNIFFYRWSPLSNLVISKYIIPVNGDIANIGTEHGDQIRFENGVFTIIYAPGTWFDSAGVGLVQFTIDGIQNTIPGCTNSTACNYNASATQDDGSCTFPAQTYLNCAGACLNDANNNGICDEVEATFPSYLPANGLVAWYPFNGNANDESGNGNHGTVNGATLTTDRNGNANSAYSFDGVSNYISTPIPYNELNNFKSITCIIKLNSYPTSDQNVFFGVSSGSPQFVVRSNGKIRIQKNTPFNYLDILESPNSIDLNTWYHLVGIFNENQIQLYLNGSLITSANYTNPIFFACSDIPFQIGGFNYSLNCGGNYSDQFVNSIIDDIAIYNRALTQEEITALYNGTTNNNSGNNNNTSNTTVPAGISYQAVARNAQGTALANTAVQVKFTLITGSLSGTTEYVETHSLSTNSLGLFSTAFGTGTPVTGTWAGINWTHSNKYLKVELDAGNGFVDLGTQQLLSSPFAIRAQSAATLENGDLPIFADNAAAIAGGLTAGKLYRTATGELKVVY